MTRDDTGREARRQQLLLAALWRQAPDDALAGWLRDVPARAARGLAAYRINGAAGAERALQASYPAVALAIGDEALAALARRLWRTDPPTHGDLALWGGGLAALVEAEAPLADWPWLADLARLDWAVHRAEAAADGPDGGGLPPGLALLGEPGAENCRVALRPGTAVLRSRWPLVDLWRAHVRPGDAAADPADAVQAALACGQPQCALVRRDGWRADVEPLSPADAAFTAALLGGAVLGEALSCAAAVDAPPPFAFEDWLLRAVQQRWITAVGPEATAAAGGPP